MSKVLGTVVVIYFCKFNWIAVRFVDFCLFLDVPQFIFLFILGEIHQAWMVKFICYFRFISRFNTRFLIYLRELWGFKTFEITLLLESGGFSKFVYEFLVIFRFLVIRTDSISLPRENISVLAPTKNFSSCLTPWENISMFNRPLSGSYNF